MNGSTLLSTQLIAGLINFMQTDLYASDVFTSSLNLVTKNLRISLKWSQKNHILVFHIIPFLVLVQFSLQLYFIFCIVLVLPIFLVLTKINHFRFSITFSYQNITGHRQPEIRRMEV